MSWIVRVGNYNDLWCLNVNVFFLILNDHKCFWGWFYLAWNLEQALSVLRSGKLVHGVRKGKDQEKLGRSVTMWNWHQGVVSDPCFELCGTCCRPSSWRTLKSLALDICMHAIYPHCSILLFTGERMLRRMFQKKRAGKESQKCLSMSSMAWIDRLTQPYKFYSEI